MTDEKKIRTKKDLPGEAEKRKRIMSRYGENQIIDGEYDKSLSAVCHNGVFVGKEKDSIIAFKGIPYAKPPVGELRWKPPVAAENDNTVHQAYYFGLSPIQTEWPSEEGSYYPKGEDCLTLNIWTHKSTDTDRPVMVFFHGGSYGWGATSDPLYDGHNFVFAHNDVILVTVEYRVGIMGFIDFSKVEGGEEYKESGNLGLLDHICALKWIKNNIKAFGGNPENITIFGESAGGGTVSLLAIMDSAKGLFNRIIAESGSVALTYSRDECLSLTEKLLKNTGASNMRELLSLSERELMIANEKLNDFNNFPERDGVVIPENLYKAYADGKSKDYDIIVGTNADETCYWIREMGYYSEPKYGKVTFKLGVPVMFNSNKAKISSDDLKYLDYYMSQFSYRKLWKMVAFYNDILFRVPAVYQAELHSDNGGTAYNYYWTYPSAHKNLGACHAVELAYVLNNLNETIYTGDNIDVSLAKEVQNMWVNFAKSGNPSTENNEWKPYNKETRSTVILGSDIHSVSNLYPERREALYPLLKYGFNGCYSNIQVKIPFYYIIIGTILAILGIVPALLIRGSKLLIKGIKKLFKRKDV